MYLAFLVAIAPVAAIIWYVYIKDKYDKEPLSMLALSFGLGLLSTVPAYITSEYLAKVGWESGPELLPTFFYAFLVVAFAEEFAKFLFLIWVMMPSKYFDEPYDGIVYGVMIGMGFAFFENIIYVLDGGMETALIRAFTAVPAHACFGVIMGYYVGMAKFDPVNKSLLLLKGLMAAIIFHGAYDFFIMQERYEMLTLVTFGVLLFAIFLSRRAIRIHQYNSPFNPVHAPKPISSIDFPKKQAVPPTSTDNEKKEEPLKKPTPPETSSTKDYDLFKEDGDFWEPSKED